MRRKNTDTELRDAMFNLIKDFAYLKEDNAMTADLCGSTTEKFEAFCRKHPTSTVFHFVCKDENNKRSEHGTFLDGVGKWGKTTKYFFHMLEKILEYRYQEKKLTSITATKTMPERAIEL
jgi:hypothetical protein